MYWGTWKPETRGKNPTFLEPEPDPNPRTKTQVKPETRQSKPESFSDFKVLGKITVKLGKKSKNAEKILEKFSSKSRVLFFPLF